jgi:hypothetical protein
LRIIVFPVPDSSGYILLREGRGDIPKDGELTGAHLPRNKNRGNRLKHQHNMVKYHVLENGRPLSLFTERKEISLTNSMQSHEGI